MIFIGDIHGNFELYKGLVGYFSDQSSIQVGDYGIGFPGENYNGPFQELTRHRFIRGNHDNPEVCRTNPNWIPDGTMHEGVFCVGGALSIDRALRTEGVDYWSDEEISYSEGMKILETYEKLKPDIVCSHDGPQKAINRMFPYAINDGSRTRNLLNQMHEIHIPKLHIFGHWHDSKKVHIDGCQFICLGIFEVIEI